MRVAAALARHWVQNKFDFLHWSRSGHLMLKVTSFQGLRMNAMPGQTGLRLKITRPVSVHNAPDAGHILRWEQMTQEEIGQGLQTAVCYRVVEGWRPGQ